MAEGDKRRGNAKHHLDVVRVAMQLLWEANRETIAGGESSPTSGPADVAWSESELGTAQIRALSRRADEIASSLEVGARATIDSAEGTRTYVVAGKPDGRWSAERRALCLDGSPLSGVDGASAAVWARFAADQRAVPRAFIADLIQGDPWQVVWPAAHRLCELFELPPSQPTTVSGPPTRTQTARDAAATLARLLDEAIRLRPHDNATWARVLRSLHVHIPILAGKLSDVFGGDGQAPSLALDMENLDWVASMYEVAAGKVEGRRLLARGVEFLAGHRLTAPIQRDLSRQLVTIDELLTPLAPEQPAILAATDSETLSGLELIELLRRVALLREENRSTVEAALSAYFAALEVLLDSQSRRVVAIGKRRYEIRFSRDGLLLSRGPITFSGKASTQTATPIEWAEMFSDAPAVLTALVRMVPDDRRALLQEPAIRPVLPLAAEFARGREL